MNNWSKEDGVSPSTCLEGSEGGGLGVGLVVTFGAGDEVGGGGVLAGRRSAFRGL